METRVSSVMTIKKILLVGDSGKKRDFLNEFQGDHSCPVTFTPISIYLYPKADEYFHVYDMNSLDESDFDDNIIKSCLKNTHAVIYIHCNQELQIKVERVRKPEKCIAIDFDSVKVTPKECLLSISKISQTNEIFGLSYKRTTKENGLMIYTGNKFDRGCAFANLPTEVVSYMACTLFSLQSKKYIFKTFSESVLNQEIDCDKKQHEISINSINNFFAQETNHPFKDYKLKTLCNPMKDYRLNEKDTFMYRVTPDHLLVALNYGEANESYESWFYDKKTGDVIKSAINKGDMTKIVEMIQSYKAGWSWLSMQVD